MPLDVFLRRAIARIRARDLLRAVAAGSVTAAVLSLLLQLGGTRFGIAIAIAAFTLIAIGAAVFVAAGRARTPRMAAALVEHHDRSLRNLLITAEQLQEQPGLTRPHMRDRVLAEAARRASEVDLRRTIPLARDTAFASTAVALFLVAATVALPARDAKSS